MKLKYIYFTGVFSLIISYQTPNEALETALELAGNNRNELEKVLHHYSQDPADSLKLKAAEFLIENMPGHYTLEGPVINKYRERIDADTIKYSGKKILELFLAQIDACKENSRKKEDIQTIKADYLIRHIDLSFYQLNTYPWLKDISFDIFLEYLLPYRFEHERIDLWKDSLKIGDNDLQTIINSCDKTKYTIEQNNRNSLAKHHDISPESILRIFKRDIFKDCNYLVYENLIYSQSVGHPSAIEYLPYYANRNGFHYWRSCFSPEFKYLPAILYSHERKTPKVYRRTYSRNHFATPGKNEYIPELFTDPFCKDVTSSYLHTSNVHIDIKKQISKNSRHAYLCVFNNLDWQPVAISGIQNNHAKFKDMGKGIVYLPVYYQGKQEIPVNYPFILNLKGEIHFLIPDTHSKQTLYLTRKYPTHTGIYLHETMLQDLELTASNSLSFQDSDTIPGNSPITMAPRYYTPEPEKYYRYWCFENTKRRLLEFADIVFITPEGEAIEGIIHPKYASGFDGDALTNTTLPINNKIIVDFKKAVKIAKIICFPRSDGNGIYPHDEYELFYHDLNGWQSLGQKIATDGYIKYENVPSGALYWLHNHTSGIEERIFTTEDGHIRFW